MKKFERILLINPPRILIRGRERKRADLPLGLAYLAAVLRQAGYEVQALDAIAAGFDHEQEMDEAGWYRFGSSDADILTLLDDFRPHVVGVSNLYSDGYPPAADVLRLVKRHHPEMVTLIGGAHSTAMPEATLRDSGVDYVILGEGEQVLLNLLSVLNAGRDPAGMPGIACLRDGSLQAVSQTELIRDLDSIPFPARDIFPMKEYSDIGAPHGDAIRRKPYTPIITSRGCPARCIFCASFLVHGRRFRARRPECVLDELEMLMDQGFREFHFEDDTMAFDRHRFLTLLRGVRERGLDFTWALGNGIGFHNMNEEMLKAMADSGCYSLWVPVESGDPDILRMIHKPMPYKRIKKLIRITRDLGIRANGFFMFGFPGETEEQMQRTFDFARDLELDYCSFYIATPLPGTEMYKMVEHRLPPDINWGHLKWARGNLQVGDLPAEKLEYLRNSVWLDINYGLTPDDPRAKDL